MEVKNNDKLSDGTKIAILLDAKSKMHLYPNLTDEMKEEIDETLMLIQNRYGFAELQKVADIYGWDLTPIVNKGNTAKPVTPEGKKYNSNDAKDAEAEMLRKHREFEAKFMRMLEEARKEEAKIE